MGQAFERGDKQAGNEKDKKTEGDLQGNQAMHQAASGMRVFSAFERADRFDCGGPHRGEQTKQKGHAKGEHRGEDDDAPVGRKK